MTEPSEERPAFSTRSAELGVAIGFFVLGSIVIFDSVRLGAKWLADGPQPGYFPFYLGVIICVSATITFVRGLLTLRGERNRGFVEVGQLKLVLSVLAPSAVFAGLVGWIGIYLAAALFVGLFMRWLGKYAWWKVLAVSIGNSVVFYLIFEKWFLVPLPKGPLEALLGLN